MIHYNTYNTFVLPTWRTFRSKEEIRTVLGQAGSPSGEDHSRTNSNSFCLIRAGASSAWPTLGPTPTSRNCKPIQLLHRILNGLTLILNSFITYRSAKHLDRKHTVFGHLVGGMDTLANMERVDTDNKDVPIEDIIIQRASVFVDPFTEADEQVIGLCTVINVAKI